MKSTVSKTGGQWAPKPIFLAEGLNLGSCPRMLLGAPRKTPEEAASRGLRLCQEACRPVAERPLALSRVTLKKQGEGTQLWFPPVPTERGPKLPGK